jgi:subtilisin family serine protease
VQPHEAYREQEPRYKADELIVRQQALADVQEALRAAEIQTEPAEVVGEFRVLRLMSAGDFSPNLVVAALRILQEQTIGDKPVAEPNYIYGCPQMRGGQFVLPDPMERSVTFDESPVGDDVRVLVFDTIYVAPPSLTARVPAPGTSSADLADPVTGELAPSAGHSAFIVGQILRVAPGAVVAEPITVLDGQGDTTDALLANALNAIDVSTDPPHIVNLSLGGYTLNDTLPMVLEQALQRLQDAGTVIVAAAGNNDSPKPWFPAAAEALTVSVGAVVKVGGQWARSAYSNHGDWVDFCAPGLLNGPFPEWGGQPQPYAGWASWSGTSFAAPIVAGAIAALMSKPGVKDPTEAVQLLHAQSPGAPPDFANAKVVDPPLLWPHCP